MKTCRICAETKLLTEFYALKGGRDGRRPECKACNLAKRAQKYREDPRPHIERVQRWREKNPERYRENQRRYAADGRKKVANRKSHLKRKYALSLEQFDTMLAAQGGGCAICGTENVDNVDHDHGSGAVRGILCFKCNVAIGQLDDESERAYAVGAYLDRDDELSSVARERVLALTRPA